MGVRFPSVFSGVVQNPLPASAVETVIATSPPFTLPLDSGASIVRCFVGITAGTGTTSVSLSIKRGTTAGALALLGLTPHTLAAGNSALLAVSVIDAAGSFAGVQYSLTIVQTGATAAGVLNALEILVFAL